MQRRNFMKAAGIGLASVTLAACGQQECSTPATAQPAPDAAAPGHSGQTFEWKMVTTWPKDFPGLGSAANRLAALIGEMSGGRIHIKVFGANELVPPFEVFDAVSRGTAEMGHGSAYYWKGKSEAAQFFSTVPFGLTAQEMNGWLYYGGGLELWRELYERFGLIPFPAGNTGVQMGGWFNREINSLEDLKGLKMRIPGLGGEVLRRAGGTPVNLPGGELFTSLQSGAIDATEWVGPYNDLTFGLYKAAKYYYYPGFHEPGTTLEAMVNKTAYLALPEDLQRIVEIACKAVNLELLSEYTARNPLALETLLEEHQVDLRVYPADVMDRLNQISAEVVAELADRDEYSRRVYDSYHSFATRVRKWGEISEAAYLRARQRKQP